MLSEFRYLFFFFKQKTAYEMRISDWSSDVCSSDLARKTLSRFRALARRSSYPQSGKAAIFASDAPLLPTREPTGGIRKRERDRAERARSEGSPKPSLTERAVAFARERGVIRTKDLNSIGIPRCYLSPMCAEGLLVRVGYGRYILAPQDRKSIGTGK